MRVLNFILVLFLGLWVAGCASKSEFKESQSVSVLLKSDQFRFSEAGFLYKDEKNTRLEVYKLAQPLFALEIQPSKVCLNQYCTKKGTFNEKFFGNAHYDELLEDVLGAKPIFKGVNLKKTSCGFTQNITSKSWKFDIAYKVCGGAVDFSDKKNKIFFSMKKLGE